MFFARPNLPKIRPNVKRKKSCFPLTGCFAPIFGHSARVIHNPKEDSHAKTPFYAQKSREYNPRTLPKTVHWKSWKAGEKRVSAQDTFRPALPFVADSRNGTSYAPWQVWSGSTTKPTRFVPIPKKAAIRIYHKAVDWNRRGKLAGRHGGLIGSHVLLVLHTLIFEFPQPRAPAASTRLTTPLQKPRGFAVKPSPRHSPGLRNSESSTGFGDAREDRDADGRFVLRQETNAYAILPPSQWRGYAEAPEAGTTAPKQHGEPARPCPLSSNRHARTRRTATA